MNEFWDKKTITSTKTTFEGNKRINKNDYKFLIHQQDGRFAFSNSIEVRHIIHGEIDWSDKSISFKDIDDLTNFIEVLCWLKEETKTLILPTNNLTQP